MFSNLKGKKIAIYTLGCKTNQYESDSMMDILAEAGCEVVNFDEFADVYIVNTCAVTNMAERKSRQIIHRAKKKNEAAIVVACGCYVQTKKEETMQDLSIDLIVGNNCKKDIAKLLSQYFDENKVEDNYIDINASVEYESMQMLKPREHTRAYVKVQDGCNNFCTYCIIPYVRGRIRSRKLDEVIAEITNLANSGVREVVLTGINLSSYQDEEKDLLDLILAISEIDGILRIRLGSLEPRIITERFLNGLVACKKFCPHFHLSLQSACNETLKRMNRHYTIEEYKEKCDMIRAAFDRPALTTDVIVGFPGETDEDFEVTYKNLDELSLYEMHIFKYSRRQGTLADKMPDQVPEQIKDVRSDRLLALTAKKKQEFEASFAGEELMVLVEEVETKDGESYLKGHTDRYLLVSQKCLDENPESNVNQILAMKY